MAKRPPSILYRKSLNNITFRARYGGSNCYASSVTSKSRSSDPLSSNTSYENVSSLDDDIRDFSQLPQDFGSNQHMPVSDELRDSLRAVLWQFKAPIRFAFAYGSGVFSQKSYNSETKPMVDYIFGVSYAQHFHSLNLSQHFNHYSFLRRLGSGVISRVQTRFGAGVYFNPYVQINGMMIKYGVVLIDDLCQDLSNWNTLYLAGRMHKPIKILRDHPQVRMANQKNLISAIRTALLLLPENFTEYDLYTTIARISYMGDPRTSFAENPKKVDNIVSAQLPNFRRLYSPLIERLPNIQFKTKSTSREGSRHADLVQDLDPTKRGNMVHRLPPKFRSHLYYQYRRKLGRDASDPDLDLDSPSTIGTKFDQQIAADADLHSEVAKSIKATVSWPSTSQSIKGILTAGPIKSWSYATEKLRKAKQGKPGSNETN